jgi:hypothetical protein
MKIMKQKTYEQPLFQVVMMTESEVVMVSGDVFGDNLVFDNDII